LIQVDGVILTYGFADTALLLFQIQTAFINVCDQGDGLGEVDVDGFVLRYLLIELIRVFDRAVFNASRTTLALVLQNIARLPNQRYFEVSCLPLDAIDFSVG
jgi:hypothetical protein